MTHHFIKCGMLQYFPVFKIYHSIQWNYLHGAITGLVSCWFFCVGFFVCFGFLFFLFSKRESCLMEKHRNNKIKKVNAEEKFLFFSPADHQKT